MAAGRTALAVTGVVLVLVYAAGSALWVETNSTWYSGLKRPPWQPPDVVFGLIWPYNFTVLGFALVLITQRLSMPESLLALGCFAVSVAAALTWSYLFYVPHHLGPSAAALALTTVLTIPVLVLTFRASLVTGALLVPYQVWVGVATSLAWGYARLN